MNIARQNLQTAEKLYEVAQAKRRMGTISENDVLQLRLDVLTARSALTNSESTRQARQFALRSFLDVEAPIAATIPEASALGIHLDYEDVLAHALQNNALATTMRRRQMEADYAVASLDWGKRKGQRRLAESNRDIIQGQLRQQSQDFRQDIFILTEQFNNQAEQLRIACEADTIARRRYHTNVETFKIGSISTLELSSAQTAKDQARQNRIQQLFNYWYYYYQLRSIALWDFERGCELTADVERLIEH